MGLFRKIRFSSNPLTYIIAVIAIFSMVGGFYIVSPLIEKSTAANGAGALVTLLSTPAALKIYGGVYAASGIALLASVVMGWERLLSWALFANMLIRLYRLIGNFITVGFLPLDWLGNAITILVVLICYVTIRIRLARRGLI